MTIRIWQSEVKRAGPIQSERDDPAVRIWQSEVKRADGGNPKRASVTIRIWQSEASMKAVRIWQFEASGPIRSEHEGGSDLAIRCERANPRRA
ncbi:hypothetical protein QUF72_20635 [Desulfobacterales bacterium HSG2]|nr:hypothetical protein [Desulfobacterales bacterium HSG2]